MEQRPIRFYSDRLALEGDLYLPGEHAEGARHPAVVILSGYQGFKDIHPARFARQLTTRGWVCLGFDYRGFGDSAGERGRLVPQEQIEDARAAVSLLETLPEVDSERIGLLGWALGGGVAVATAAGDRRVRAVAAVNAIADGERSLRAQHDEDTWRELIAAVAVDRRQRARAGESRLVDPFEIVRLDDVTRLYVERDLYRDARFSSSQVSLESVDYLLRFSPETVVERIAPRPLLLIHGADNRLHPPQESAELHRRAGEPKELVLLEGAGHTEWMLDDHPTFRHVAGLVGDFFARRLEAREHGDAAATAPAG